jgi:phosphate transport system protein
VAIELAMVARFYERFGDHAVNLARRMTALVSGGPEPGSSGPD